MTGILLLIARIALALFLYAFLGWVIFTLWQNLQQQKKSLEQQRPPELWLQIRLGEAPQNHLVRGSEIILGRDPSCECVLPSDTVSARHARLTYHHGQWWLEDLKSTNGTFLNRDRVKSAVVVVPGDQIRCGEAVIHLLDKKETE